MAAHDGKEGVGVGQRERESLAENSYGADPASDPHTLLFGSDDDDYREVTGEFPAAVSRPDAHRLSRSEERRLRSRDSSRKVRRRGWYFVVLIVLLLAVVGVGGYTAYQHFFGGSDDYHGAGTGTVSITIAPGATAGDIGADLANHGVVKTAQAFTDAAANNPKSRSIQPGTYTLHRHMSGVAALTMLLNPSSRDRSDMALVTEGATTLDVAQTIDRVCGADKSAETTKALHSTAAIGVPSTYKIGSKLPSSAEGFLYPATYQLNANCSPQAALQKMVSRFIQQDRSTGFADSAKHIGLTPYRALIIASIAQSEAKYPQDMPKVVRTILNRIRLQKPLQFDSTSSYACKLAGTTHCIYNQVNSPYNTYTHMGLPPTPIDNPGADAMHAAVHPAAGPYLYFVNRDKAGHLIFTNSEKVFEKARERCAKNNWGCG